MDAPEAIQVVSSRYQQVAVDIAAKIVEGKYEVGDKIYARSLIASQYSVSSETARRAVAILSDLGIVETVKGSGVRIRSNEHAAEFLKQFQTSQTLSGLKREAAKRLDGLMRDGEALKKTVSMLVDYTNQFRSSNPFLPYELPVEEGYPSLGQSLASLHFWQNTGATVIAIRRRDCLMLSPGPYVDLEQGDILYFVGDESCPDRVLRLLTARLEACE